MATPAPSAGGVPCRCVRFLVQIPSSREAAVRGRPQGSALICTTLCVLTQRPAEFTDCATLRRPSQSSLQRPPIWFSHEDDRHGENPSEIRGKVQALCQAATEDLTSDDHT